MKSVYTMADLPELAGLHPPVRLGVIGNPIAHSISPPMQQAALDAAQLPLTYIRLLCERDEGDFPSLIRALQRAGFVGVNVTVPFKKQAYALADRADALSRLCGAANTLLFCEDGTVECFNTDGPGFARAIEALCGRQLSELRVALLGACGGAGSALAAQCVLAGCPALALVNRPRPELQQMAAALLPHAPAGAQISAHAFAEAEPAIRSADLVVNATSLGLAAGDAPPIPPEWLSPGQVVYDIVTHDTALVSAAKQRGCTASTGQSMLLWQGALAFEHWFGQLPAVELMGRALS